MITQFFPRGYKRYLSLIIFGSIIEDFIVWAHKRGYTTNTIKHNLYDIRHIDSYFLRQDIQCLDDLNHNNFERAWYYYCRHIPRISGVVRQIELFLKETRGLPSASPQPKTPIDSEIDHYVNYLCNVRGLATRTVKSHTRYINDFLKYLCYDSNPKVLKLLTPKEIEGFIYICSKKMNRYSLQHIIGYLRSFLRFQYEQGVIERPFYTMIDTPRIYRLEQLPRSLPWELINEFMLSIAQDSAQGIRDYTMLYLVATYGLRAGEVISLTLDDICWRAGLIQIPQSKTGKQLVLPLTDAAGDVLIKYLKKSRPKVSCRQLFLHARAPYGPLRRNAVGEMFKRRIRMSGLRIPIWGIHCLRHSYAVHLLRQGASVKAIGDLLGHSSAESTCVYLRLDIEDLRGVALPVPTETNIDDVPMNLVLEHYKQTYKNRKNTHVCEKKSLPPLRSFLSESISNYIQLKRSLGRAYSTEADILYSFDAFLANRYQLSSYLTAEMFSQWCTTLHRLSPTVRRRHMYIVRNLCLYHCRSYPQSFVPDVLTFPNNHQPITPYIFSEEEIARLMSAARYLRPFPYSCFPLRSETLRLAILLLYTTGLRRGELLRLKLGDYNLKDMTLLIEDTKFHKSRLLPLSSSVVSELNKYLTLRHKNRLPMDTTSPLIWNGIRDPDAKGYTGAGLYCSLSALFSALKIYTNKGHRPRIHDIRHSFAVNVLMKWYQNGEDVQARLPQLSTYMGHVSIVSTHYYLQFIEGISLKASARFRQNFVKVITTNFSDKEQNGHKNQK